ncbi:serine/threonine protein kinase [Ktedonobacter robiniae]|uniref:non-specific serine/threonine protein kinase n=1 Tax=Ktedonobacter robiniae TaxID=2778365 RepID=A0ABQ3V4P7_9CHLR|nr:serine/threonine-protein kinase [Ktedonobacter robiniae]GHO59859.1 hypothetical protein KSB_83340 [Ktedonobacter robiniae]
MPQEKIQLNGYEITETVFRGHYSTLYRGAARDDKRPVFIRNWPMAHIASERKQQRLQVEVEKLKSLNEHPHILDTYELVIGEQGMALVSEAAQQDSLQARLADTSQAPFAQEEAFAIIEQIGSALVAAHAQGVVHANVTPETIYFRQEGEAALTDFRLRNMIGAISDYHAYIEDAVPRSLYMAPEQFDGRVSQAVDQYALACLAYMLLTGRAPFAGTARATLLQKHKNEMPIPPSRVRPNLPAWVDPALLRALAKEPSRRFPDVQSFLAALKGKDREAPLILPTATAGSPEEPTQEFVALPTVTRETSPALAHNIGDNYEKKLSKKKVLLAVLLPLLALLVIVTTILALPRPALPPLLQAVQISVVATSAPTPTPVITRGVTPTPTVQPSPTLRPLPTAKSTSNPKPTPTPTAQPVQTTPTQTAQGQGNVAPVFECVQPHGNKYDAYFGYNNSGSSTVTILQGSTNMLMPGQYNGSQPTVFNPGRQYHVFRVTFSNGEIVMWMLNYKMATGSQYGPGC